MAERNVANKIDDLANSLNRTTDVLSTADRMIDHYRDLNKEQEHEIARLQSSLNQVNYHKEQQKYENELLHHSILKNSKHSNNYDSYSELSDPDHVRSSKHHQRNQMTSSHRKRRKKSYSKIRFKENSSSDELDTSLSDDIKRKYDLLEREVGQEKYKRSRELDKLDITLRKSLLTSLTNTNNLSNTVKDDDTLKKLQEKTEEHETWIKQQVEIKNMAEDMKILKDTVQEAIKPKFTSFRKLKAPSSDSEDLNGATVTSHYNKKQKEENNVRILREELKNKNVELHHLEEKVAEIQALDKMKSNQLKLMETQLQQEKSEKLKFLSKFQEQSDKVSCVEKEKSDLLLHLSQMKSEAKSNQVLHREAQQVVPELKLLLEKSERQRDKFYERSVALQTNTKGHEETIRQLLQENKELSSLLKGDQSKFNHQVDEVNEKYKSSLNEINQLKTKLSKYEDNLNVALKSKTEIKQKALASIKKYKTRCLQYEETLNQRKVQEIELAEELSLKKEIEIDHLLKLKENQELLSELKNTKDELVCMERKCSEINLKLADASNEKINASKQLVLVKTNCDRLTRENADLLTQLQNEVSKRKEVDKLLHENYEETLNSKQQGKSFKRQLSEQHQKYQQFVSTSEETELALKLKIRDLNGELEKSNFQNQKLEEQCSVIITNFNDMKSGIEKQRSDESLQKDLVKELKRKLESANEDNHKIRKQYQLTKEKFHSKAKELTEKISRQKQQIDQSRSDHQFNETRNVVADTTKDRDVSKILTFVMSDMENLHRLLSYEEENQAPAKDIPENISQESKDRLKDFRNKFDSCFTVIRTLKERFYYHKLLIRKAQEKIKCQIEENKALKVSTGEQVNSCKEENQFLRGQISSHKSQLNSFENKLTEKKEKINSLQNKVNTLTKHLEECTHALHKSVQAGMERKDVLNEIEQLKTEREEHQKIDENFYRCSEKLDILSDQLDEAKNSFSQLKKDNSEETTFTNKIIEKFNSVTPKKKRKLFITDSPVLMNSMKYSDISSKHPSFHSTSKNFLPAEHHHNIIGDVVSERDPMSLNDDEFNKFILSTDPLIDSSVPINSFK